MLAAANTAMRLGDDQAVSKVRRILGSILDESWIAGGAPLWSPSLRER
ncbi:hypothetical protein [Antrihabitans cavernicola]|nr:hypothetical protein [Spelaeibacter cavernicola]